MNINELLATEPLARALRAYALRQGVDYPITFWRGMVERAEPELLGLAVQLLKQRGAQEINKLDGASYSLNAFTPGRYLVVPLSALEGDNK